MKEKDVNEGIIFDRGERKRKICCTNGKEIGIFSHGLCMCAYKFMSNLIGCKES
jgi:hypothetical protein